MYDYDVGASAAGRNSAFSLIGGTESRNALSP
jgi:hypothetical protein